MWHKQVLDLGYHREVRFENAELDGLKLLITPAMPYVSDSFLLRAKDFIEQGGVWIAGPVTGTRGKEHTVPTDAGLGLLEKLAGVTTQYVMPLTGTGATGELLGVSSELSGWCAAMTAHEGTQVVGTLTAGRGKGLAFVTERRIGKGKLVLLGAMPHGDNKDDMLNTLIHHYAGEAGISRLADTPSGVVIVPRTNNRGQKIWIVLNMLADKRSVSLPKEAIDVFTGKSLGGTLSLDGYTQHVIQVTGV